MENGPFSSLSSSTGIQQSSHHYLPLLMTNGKAMSGSVFSLIGADPVVTSREATHGANGTNGTNGVRKDPRIIPSSPSPSTTTSASADTKAASTVTTTITTTPSEQGGQHSTSSQHETTMASPKHNIPTDDTSAKPGSAISLSVPATKPSSSFTPSTPKASSSTKSSSSILKHSSAAGAVGAAAGTASISAPTDLIDGALSDFEGSDLSDLSSESSASGSDRDSEGDGDDDQDDEDDSSLDEAASDDSKMDEDRGDSGSDDSSNSDDSDSQPISASKKRPVAKKSIRPRIQSDSSDGEQDLGVSKRGPGRPPKAKQQSVKSKRLRSPTSPTSPTFATHTQAKKNGGAPTEESTTTSSGPQTNNESQARKKTKQPDLAHINKRDRSGRTQLFKYTAMGDLEACRMLIEAGAQVNDRDYAEWTPLHEACVTGHDKVAELLIQHGADVNARGGHADTPLHDAAQNGHVDVVKLLLSRGANVLAKNAKGIIPIDVSDDKEVMDLLQRRQALVNMLTGKNQAGQTMLHRACSSGSYNNVTDLLNQGADINAQDNAQWTPLHEAALAGHTEVVELLLSRGAQPNAKGHGNDTALHDASQNEHEDVVKLLLEYGADPDFKNSKGEKPCDVCEHDGILELLKTGARNTKKAVIRAVDSPLFGSPSSSIAPQTSKSGANGFQSQSSTKGQDKLKRHKEGSADINMSDDGRSASEERPTQMSRDERKMQQLLSTIRMQEQMEEKKKAKKRRPKQASEDEGDDEEDSKTSRSRSKDTTPTPSSTWKHSHPNSSTNTNNINNNPSSSNQHAKSSQGRSLTKAGKNGSRARSMRSEDRNDSDSGPDVSIHSKRSFQRSTGDRIRIDHRYKDSSGRTQLHQWAEAGDIEMVGNLLEGGAERDPKDHDGSTPLHLAAKAGNTEVLVLLLAYGSNVNAQDQEKTTALHEAVRYHHLEAVRLLLQNNAIVTLRDSMKRSCFDLSSSKDSEIRTLLKTSLDQAEAKAKERSNKRLSQTIDSRGSPKHKERKTHRGSDSDEPAKAKKRSSGRREGDEMKQHTRNGSSTGHQKSSSMSAISVSHPKKLSSSSTTPTTSAPTSTVPWKNSSDMEGIESTAPLKKRQPSSQRPISLGPSALQPTEEEPETRTSSGSSKKRRETDRHGDGYGGKVKIKKEREDDAQIFRSPGLTSKPDELRRVASTPSFSKDGINGKQSRYGSTKPPTSLSSSRPSSVFGMPLGSSIASISPPLTETSTSPPPPTSSASLASQDSELQRSRKRSSQTFSSPSGYLKFQDDLKQATATKPQHQHQRQRSSASVSAPTSGSRPSGAAETSSSPSSATAVSADVDVSRKKAKTSTTDSISEPACSKQPAGALLSYSAPSTGTTKPVVPDVPMTQAVTVAPTANAPISTPPLNNSSIKERVFSVVEEPAKKLKVEESVDVVVKAESSPPPPRSAQDAQRYLPLYTVQLSNEADQVDPTTAAIAGPGPNDPDSPQQQQHFCVVDRQVQLLLGLGVTGSGSLYSRYPHLRRRLVTAREKDRLWSPLSSMVSDRCAAAVKLNYEILPVECQFSSWSTATTAMSRLKEHEKQKFLGCDLYFIRLDEVTELIRRDFPQLDDSMMTITLDIGYDEEFDMETDADQDLDLDLDKAKKEDETLKTVKEEVVEETVHLSASSSSSMSATTSLTSLASSVSSSSLSHLASQGESLSATASTSSGASGFIHKLRRVPAKMATKAMFKELQQQYHRHP